MKSTNSVLAMSKEKIEEVMKLERKAFLEEEDLGNVGTGYHARDLDPRIGRLKI